MCTHALHQGGCARLQQTLRDMADAFKLAGYVQAKVFRALQQQKDENGKVMCVGSGVSLTEEINDVLGDPLAHMKIARLHASLAQ